MLKVASQARDCADRGWFQSSAEVSFPSPEGGSQIDWVFRSGEIRVLDSTGNAERTIPFNEADRKL
jgi:hypothetical protein